MKNRLAVPAALLALALTTATDAHADRRYFTWTYSPFLDEPGEMEIETWLTAGAGRLGSGTEWQPRVEFEYAFHDRVGMAAYLNFEKSGRNVKFHSPSLELIYRLADRGRIPGDPALYLEASESGDELELESKLLLARRRERWVSGLNLTGELELRHDDSEVLPGGTVLRNSFVGEISGGFGRELNDNLSLGVETRYRSEHPNFGRQTAALLSVGPSLNLKLGETQLALGVLPQVWGTPKSTGSRNLGDFHEYEVRAILGVEL